MVIEIENCTTLTEQIIVWGAFVSIPMLILSAFVVLTNEKEVKNKNLKDNLIEIFDFSPFYHLVSKKMLNSTGAKWQPIFSISFFITILSFSLTSFLNLCQP